MIKASWDVHNRSWHKTPKALNRAQGMLPEGTDPERRFGCVTLGPLMVIFSA